MRRILFFLVLITPQLQCMEYLKALINYPTAKLIWEVGKHAAPEYIAAGDIETARWCLENGADANITYDFIDPDPQNNNPVLQCEILGLAALSGYNRDFIELLLIHGANPNPITAYEASALCLTAINGDLGSCRLLLEHGADSNEPVRLNGVTPLMLAAGRGHAPLCQLLIEHGADINKPSLRGLTALAYAASNGHDRICELLHEHGAIPSQKDRCFLATHLLTEDTNNDLDRCKLLIDCEAFLHYAIGEPDPILVEEALNQYQAPRGEKILAELICPPRVKDDTITKPGARDALGNALAPLDQADRVGLLIDAGAHCSYNQFGRPRVMRILILYPTILKKVCYAPTPDMLELSPQKLITLLACIKYSPSCAQHKFPKDVQKLLAIYCLPQELVHCMIKRRMAGKQIEPRFESITLHELYAATIAQLRTELTYSQKNMGLLVEHYNPANHGLAVTAETIEERYGTEIQANIKDRFNRKQLRCNNVIPELE